MPFDPVALDHQLALLRPLATQLRAETWSRRPIDPVAWDGPAAEAARELELRMLAGLRDAASSLEDLVHRIGAARSAQP